MSTQARRSYEFGPFLVDAAERRLLREEQPIQLPPKVFDTLLALVSNGGHLLTKDELLRTVWRGTFVEENNLTQNISHLRKVLGDDNGYRYIETVPRIGYRFAAGVREILDDDEEMVVENRTRLQVVVREEESEEEGETRGHGDRETRRHRDSETRRARDLYLPASPRLRVAVSLLAVAVVIGLTAVLIVLVNRAGKREALTAKPTAFKSVAVLPFKIIGESSDGDYLSVGMADTLIAKLSHVKQLNLRPISAVHRFTGLGQDPIAAGRTLGVDAVLDGRIQRANGRLRVTVELLSVRDGAVLWTETLDEYTADIFTLQDKIAARVVASLHSALTTEERTLLAKRYTTNPQAYEAYLKGRFFWNKRTGDDFKKAIEYFEQAIRIAPNYAQAYAGLADSFAFMDADRARAKAALMKALELDDTLAEAHTSLALNMLAEWKWPEAGREFRRAVELNPNYAAARHWYAYYFAAVGDMENALAEIRRAQELDPLSIIINTDAGQMFYYAQQYDRAIEQLRKAIEMDPSFVMAHVRLAEAYAQNGMGDEAIAEFQKVLSLPGGLNLTVGVIGYAYAVSGKRAEAVKMLGEWEGQIGRAPQRMGYPYWLATVHAALGERDRAFRWLDKAYEQHHAEMLLIKVEPRFNSLRGDARFADLLRRMNLA